MNYGVQLLSLVDRAICDDIPAANDFVGTVCKVVEDVKQNSVRANQR